MASISNQWLKGGKDWFPVHTKLELYNSDFADYELTFRKEIGVYKCLNNDCLNNNEKEYELNGYDINSNYPPRGSCSYCYGSLEFVEKKLSAEHHTIFLDRKEGNKIVNLITQSFNEVNSTKYLTNLIDKLSDKSKLKIIKKYLTTVN